MVDTVLMPSAYLIPLNKLKNPSHFIIEIIDCSVEVYDMQEHCDFNN